MTTPPPQDQAPYPPQGQAPYPPQPGFPQQGQAPYPPQPGFPQQATAPYAPVPPAPKRKISFRTIRTIVVILIAAGGAIYGYVSSQHAPNTAKVGDCMHRGNSSNTNPELKVVDCGSSQAQYVVLAKIEGLYATDTMASSKCASEAKNFKYTYTESGDGKDFLLCLKDK